MAGLDTGLDVATTAAALAARNQLRRLVAQELEGPIAAVLLQIEDAISLVGCGQPELLKRLDRTRSLVERIAVRATTLFDAPRLAEGAFRPEARRFDMAELVRDVAAASAPQAQHAGCRLRVAAAAPLAITGDWLAVWQIVDTLLARAVTQNGGTVEISLARLGATAQLSVRGDAAADGIELLDESFERAIAGGVEIIGLWIARRLGKGIGGRLMVAHSGERNCTVAFALPLDGAQADPRAPNHDIPRNIYDLVP